MRAETLRDLVEQKINERWLDGMLEGPRAGIRVGRREVLCSLAGQRFGTDTGDELAALLDGVKNTSELARIGTLIIDCESGSDFLARARR